MLNSARCHVGLNALNFFVAAMQTAFGPFFVVYLAERGFDQIHIGIALSVGTAAALLFQLPAGWVVDHIHLKRIATAIGLLLLALSSLLVVFTPLRGPAIVAQIVHGFASCMLTPAVAALTLVLSQQDQYSERLGINGRYASIGATVAAVLLGAFAHYYSEESVFLVATVLVIPGLASLVLFRGSDRVPEENHPAILHPRERKRRQHRAWHIFKETPLHTFALALVLFQLANAAVLPLLLSELAKRGQQTGFITTASIVVPQAVVVICSPWAGRLAQTLGRRPALLVGFAALPLRALLFAGLPDAVPAMAIQMLDGVSATVIGLMVPLIAADLTQRSGFLNMAIGSLGLATGIGATASTTVAGWIADKAGAPATFLVLALVGLSAFAVVWLMMPETRPGKPLSNKPVMVAA